MDKRIKVRIDSNLLAKVLTVKNPSIENAVAQFCSIKNNHSKTHKGGFIISKDSKNITVFIEDKERKDDILCEYEMAAVNNGMTFEFLESEIFYEVKIGKLYWIDDDLNY